MAIYTVARLVEDLKTIARQATSDWFSKIGLQMVEETLAEFYSPRWPFNRGEGVFTTIAPYSDGQITLTKGSQAVAGVGTAWDVTWPTFAILRPATGGTGDSFLVSNFGSVNGLTIDKPWPYTSAGPINYRLEFPSYDVPAYISLDALYRSFFSGWQPIQPSDMESMLSKRDRTPFAFYPDEYYVTPSDGTTSAKVWVWPSPNIVHTVRYRYTKAIPDFYYYRDGSATCTNGSAAVTAVGSKWKKLGYNIVGQYFEITGQPTVNALISANATDTALTLSANWQGQDAADQPYAVSPGLLVPLDLRPLLRSLVKWKYFADAVPQLAPTAHSDYQKQLSIALGRQNVSREAREIQPIFDCDHDGSQTPSIPWVLQVAGP